MQLMPYQMVWEVINSYQYTYDDLYRLTTAQGTFNPNQLPQISQNLSMTYSASGNILEKSVNATTLNNQTLQSVAYNNSYTYTGSKPHAVSSAGNFNYLWDNNGNMLQRSDINTPGNHRTSVGMRRID
jgi:hypothetical protein